MLSQLGAEQTHHYYHNQIHGELLFILTLVLELLSR